MNYSPENETQLALVQSGSENLQTLLEGHLESLMDLRTRHEVHDADLLTSGKRWWGFPDRKVKKAIDSLHERIRNLIHEIATRIEEQNYGSAEQAIQDLQISMEERSRALHLIQADRKIQTSCTALKLTIDFFTRFNQWIVSRMEYAANLPPEEERKLVLCNAILVFELTQFCIQFLEGFAVEGIEEVRESHKKMKKIMSDLRDENQRLRHQAKNRRIDPALAQGVLRDVEMREEAIRILEQEWQDYLRQVDSLGRQGGLFHQKLPGLRLVRDNAKAQVNVLSAISILQLVKNNIASIESAAEQISHIELVALSPDRVRRLLRVDFDHSIVRS